MDDAVAIVEERGSHLLVRYRGRFAVLERRDGKIYGLSDGRRPTFDETPEGMAAAVGDGWRDEAGARRVFDEATRRGDELAQRLW